MTRFGIGCDIITLYVQIAISNSNIICSGMLKLGTSCYCYDIQYALCERNFTA